MIPAVGFRNGDLVAKNITFDYTTDPQPAQPGVITADAQLLIGSIDTTPDIAMSAGVLKSDGGSIAITYDYPDINLDLVGGGGLFAGLIGASNGVTAVPDGANKVTVASANGTVVVNGGGSTIDLNALPTVQNHLKININGLTDVSPTAADPSKFLFTATGGMTITNPLPNTINFDSAGGGGGTLNTLTPDIGGVVNPSAGNINVFGLPILAGQTVSLQTSTYNDTSPTLRIKAPNCALFIVDADPLYGTHTTIQSAVNDAATYFGLTGVNTIVFIRPGVYTENITMANGVNLANYTADQNGPTVQINGLMTIPTGTITSLTNIVLRSNGGGLITTAAGSSTTTLINCILQPISATAITMLGGTNVILEGCTGLLQNSTARYFTGTSAAISFVDCIMYNVNLGTLQNTMTDGTIIVIRSIFQHPITASGNCAIGFSYSQFETGGINTTSYTANTSLVSQTDIVWCEFTSGTAPAITIAATAVVLLQSCIVSSTAANAITGAGWLQYTPITYTGLSKTISVTTQTPIGSMGPAVPIGDGGCYLMSGSGSPNGVVTAPLGSIWMRSDVGASVNNRAFINTNGATSWTAFLTAA